MERIASFTVDHTKLQPGMYLSRQDGAVVTYDLRFKRPNTGDLLSNAELHSAEHLFATLLRNSACKDAVLYFGPMGCPDRVLSARGRQPARPCRSYCPDAGGMPPGCGLRRTYAGTERRGVRQLP